MIIGLLLVGILTSVFCAASALLLGHGFLIAIACGVLGGNFGMICLVVVIALRPMNRAVDMPATVDMHTVKA